MQFISDSTEQIKGGFAFRLTCQTPRFKTIVVPADDLLPEQTGVLVQLSPEEIIAQFEGIIDRARAFLASESEEEMAERHARYADASAEELLEPEG